MLNERKLLLCSGPKQRGWTCVDSDPANKPDIIASMPPLPDFVAARTWNHIELIHGIEHFYKWQVRPLLCEIYKCMAHDGVLVLEQPNIEQVAKWMSGVESPPANTDQFLMWPLYGDPSHKSDGMCHKWGWTPSTLEDELRACGYTDISHMPARSHKPERDFRIEARKQPAASFWDRCHPSFWDQRPDLNAPIWEVVGRAISPFIGGSILEIGCGTGKTANTVFSRFMYSGIDISSVSTYTAGINIRCGDFRIEELQPVDVIYCGHVLAHLDDFRVGLTKMLDTARKCVVVAFVHPLGDVSVIRKKLDGTWDNQYAASEVKELAENHGWAVKSRELVARYVDGRLISEVVVFAKL